MEPQDTPVSQPQDASMDEVHPDEIYERMASYVSETDNLISMLRDNLMKSEAQLTALTSFDSRVGQLGGTVTPIDTGSLQTMIEDIRKHIGSLEEFRQRVKSDMDKVKQISDRINDIVSQYKA